MYLINALCDIARALVVGAHHIACTLEQFGALELGPLRGHGHGPAGLSWARILLNLATVWKGAAMAESETARVARFVKKVGFIFALVR